MEPGAQEGVEPTSGAGKNGLTRDTQRDATTDEVRALKDENASLKKALAESVPERWETGPYIRL